MKRDLLGLRYREGRTKNHVESWFLKVNEPDGRRALWVRCTIFAQEALPPVAEAWAIAFDRHRGQVAVKTTVPFGTARFAKDALDVDVDGSQLSPERAKGVLSSGRGTLAWDVALKDSGAAPIVHFPTRAMYADALPPLSKLVTPVADARATGALRVDRGGDDVDLWEIEEWPAMIGHNWGRGHPELYAWTHCNAWNVPGLVFEAVSARARIGPMLTPMATLAWVRWNGRRFDLARARALTRNRGAISLRRWEMTGEDAGVTLTCDVAAETDDFVGLHYPNPTGPMTYCLATNLARARLELKLPDGEVVQATSRAAALEIGTLESEHGTRMYL